MKRNIVSHAMAAFLLFTLLTSASAQSIFHKFKERYSFAYGDTLANSPGDISLAERRVPEPVLKAFYRSFGEASGKKWCRVGKYYLVHFTSDSNENRCLYDVKGHLKYSIYYGTEKDLPVSTCKLVKREYLEYKILQAIKAHEDDRDIWVIYLSDDTNIIIARVEDNALEEVTHYRTLNAKD